MITWVPHPRNTQSAATINYFTLFQQEQQNYSPLPGTKEEAEQNPKQMPSSVDNSSQVLTAAPPAESIPLHKTTVPPYIEHVSWVAAQWGSYICRATTPLAAQMCRISRKCAIMQENTCCIRNWMSAGYIPLRTRGNQEANFDWARVCFQPSIVMPCSITRVCGKAKICTRINGAISNFIPVWIHVRWGQRYRLCLLHPCPFPSFGPISDHLLSSCSQCCQLQKEISMKPMQSTKSSATCAL